MKRLALLLVLIALPAGAATLIINGVPTEGTVVITTGAVPTPPPAPTPPAPTQPPPPPASAPPGWSVAIAPISASGVPLMVGTGHTFRFSAGANTIHAHRLHYTDGRPYAGISMNQMTNNTAPRDAVISATPGSMTAINPYCRKMRNGLGASFDIAFAFEPGYCVLAKNTTYYLNIKASDANTPINYLVVP